MRTDILYEDEQIIVAYKPAGLAVQTAKVGEADMVSELKNYLQGGYLGVVHRLDQPVEGLLVFGKTKAAAGDLTRQLSEGTLHKRYCAAVCGRPSSSRGELVDYMSKTSDNRAVIVAPDGLEGSRPPQKAILRYRLLEERGEISLMDIRIGTGRFHQIRAQMAHAGMPLLGDLKYGTERALELGGELGARGAALCACELELTHPVKKERLRFQKAPEGDVFRRFAYFHDNIWQDL